MQINKGKIFGVCLVVFSVGLIAFQATKSESSVTFYTPAEVYANPTKFEAKVFRVSGLVMKGSKVWIPESRDLSFRISDLNGHDFNVKYVGVPPDLFKEGQGVIIEGRLQDNHKIQADLLMVKHSEVYDTKKDHSQMREAKLLDSMLKTTQESRVQ